ncbi:hypothetical protein [Chryseobacterium sp.]|uniref:hypothetical protein n=1 Tax=Chryseobacterium sp. TaxID=1871047 RepID=UPI001B00AEEE|nr:hypothetical protein [Chryseobacterium sp.]MBO9694557.1 hypothetical protein [Chryseobacterium sp.]
MENKEKMIERIAESTGQSYEKVESDINSLISLGSFSNAATEVLKQLSDEMQGIKTSFPPKRRKPTNYTKPRNRKKKSKY